jgi:GntR family transcriptional regulator / MocR family aminotransferase
METPIEKLRQFAFEEFGPPRYEQLAAYFERAIRGGEFSAGDRLPTVRRLSALMRVSATTISSAFDLLGNRKFVRAEVGRGTFVVSDWQDENGDSLNSDAASLVSNWTDRNGSSSTSGRVTSTRSIPMLRGMRNPWRRNALMRASSRLRATYPSAMECSTGRPDARLLPLEVIRRAWASCTQEVTSADLQYAGAEPIKPLADILIPIFEGDLIPARTQDLIVGSSAQQFFALIYEVARVKSEKSTLLVAVEEPGYPTLFDTLDRAGGRLLGIAVDRLGAIPASLDAALRDGARMVILTPRGHNPTGASWSPDRLSELADVLKSHPDAIVVEDDQVAGITTTKPGSLLSVPELENRVLHIRSFSKSIAPDLRMAAAVARPLLREPLSEAKTYADGWSSRLLQRVLARTLETEEATAALNKARDAYRDRRQSACAALNQIVVPRGGACWPGSDGVNVWVHLPPGVDSKHIQERSAAAGVRIADGEPFFIAPGQNEVVRINAGSVEAQDAAKAGKIVGQAILDYSWHHPGPIHV